MTKNLITEGKFTYAEAGEGQAIVILHGLMGALSNFDETFNHFSKKGYKVLIPELPLYSLPLLKTNIKNLAKFLNTLDPQRAIESKITYDDNGSVYHLILFYRESIG